MLRLRLQRNTHHVLGFGRGEADSIACDGLVELLGSEENRAFETPAILQFLAAANVLADRERQLDKQGKQSEDERPLVDVPELISGIDRAPQIGVKATVDVLLFGAAIEHVKPASLRVAGKRKWDLLALRRPKSRPPARLTPMRFPLRC